MVFDLKRLFLKDKYTIGRLYADSVFLCNTLEDPVRDFNKEEKVYGETAIPYGTYKITVRWSQRFKRRLPFLENVKHFTGIAIHRGNTPADTHGCILPGENKAVGKVLNSTKYEKTIIEMCDKATANKEEVIIKIT